MDEVAAVFRWNTTMFASSAINGQNYSPVGAGTRMKTLTAKEAKYGFGAGRCADTRAGPLAVHRTGAVTPSGNAARVWVPQIVGRHCGGCRSPACIDFALRPSEIANGDWSSIYRVLGLQRDGEWAAA